MKYSFNLVEIKIIADFLVLQIFFVFIIYCDIWHVKIQLKWVYNKHFETAFGENIDWPITWPHKVTKKQGGSLASGIICVVLTLD